jgi:hypothetical protein
MFNRRTFLKTTATALPMVGALGILEPGFALSDETVATAAVSGDTPNLMPLPQRLPVDLASEPWQQRIRRVGQSNISEHDPAVMNVEEWASYWHSARADIVFVSVTGILAYPRR